MRSPSDPLHRLTRPSDRKLYSSSFPNSFKFTFNCFRMKYLSSPFASPRIPAYMVSVEITSGTRPIHHPAFLASPRHRLSAARFPQDASKKRPSPTLMHFCTGPRPGSPPPGGPAEKALPGTEPPRLRGTVASEKALPARPAPHP